VYAPWRLRLVTPLEGFLFLTFTEGGVALFEILLFCKIKSVGLPDVATAPKIDKELSETSQILN
jgi:hypothetical protein